MTWTADPHAVEQLQHIFKGTLSTSSKVREEANEALSQARSQPEIENYLCELLIRTSGATADVRAAAGINLKNLVLSSGRERPYLRENILAGLLAEDSMVRNITGNVITALFLREGVEKWPQALPHLVELAGSSGNATAEAAAGALAKICEDSAAALDREVSGERPLDFLVASLLTLCSSPHAKVRALSVHSINQFVPLRTQLLLVHLDAYLGQLFALAEDASGDVRKNICQAFVHVWETRPDKLVPHLSGVVDYCAHLLLGDDEDVALEACEFLLALATAPETEKDALIFAPKLTQVLPVLVQKMVYSEEELFLLEMEAQEAAAEDRDEDVRPAMARLKETRAFGTRTKSGDDDSDSEFEDESDDDVADHWTVRKCSAATLDLLLLDFPVEVLQITLPLLQERLVAPEWPVREAAILALGAVSSSCVEHAGDRLPAMVPFLVKQLEDAQQNVRKIACWTLSRYAAWVASEARAGGACAAYFAPVFELVVVCVRDRLKAVQEAACLALSAFIEEAEGDQVGRYCDDIMSQFLWCLASYPRRNMVVLYDCIQTFVEKMGERLQSAECVNMLLPPLLQKWQALDDNDTALWPLLECMASVAATLGPVFAPYAPPVYERAVRILHQAIEQDQMCHTDPHIDPPEKDFVVTALDLVDGLVQGFGADAADLIRLHGGDLMGLVSVCMEDHTDDVRQLAYSLVGDLAIYTIDATLRPHLRTVVLAAAGEISNRSYLLFPVYNNAIWALGEILMRVSYEEMAPYAANLVALLIPVLTATDTQQTVAENAAICLGRMGIYGAGAVGPRLPEFMHSWCAQMLYLVENSEKETAFLGMLKTVALDPDHAFGGLQTPAGRKNLATFITCIGCYLQPPDLLKAQFADMLGSLRALLADSWDSVMGQVDQETRLHVYNVYGC